MLKVKMVSQYIYAKSVKSIGMDIFLILIFSIPAQQGVGKVKNDDCIQKIAVIWMFLVVFFL